MACDTNQLLANAACIECNLTGDLYPAVEIVLWCAIRDRISIACNPAALIAQAECVRRCIPLGAMNAVKARIICQVLSK